MKSEIRNPNSDIIRVLLIEDNPGDARLIRELLAEERDAPVALDWADRLSAGLERLAAGNIAGVLLDLSLPDSQGLETFLRVNAQAPEVPIVVLTGLADEALAARAVREGAQDYLVKGEVDGNLLIRSLRYAITRKRGEQALKTAKDYAENLINSSLDMIISVDMDRSILEFNKAAEQTFGYSKAEILGRPADLLYADPSLGSRIHKNTFKDGGFAGEVVNKKKNGEAFYSFLSASVMRNSSGEAVGVVGISRDITQRREAEAELAKTRVRLQHLLASSPTLIYTSQGSGDFACTFVSENFQSMMGYAPQEMLQDPRFWVSHVHPEDAPRLLSGVHAMLPEGGGTVEYRFQHRDGHYRWIQDTFKLICDNAGRPVEIVGSWTDITERKRAEEALYESKRHLEDALAELKSTQEKVLQQERLRALGQMASGIAHDFNNALSPVLGFSELLLDRPERLDDKEKVKYYLQMMNTAARDGASIVRRLREFYRPREENEAFLPVNLNALVKQVIVLTQPRWKDQALASGTTITIDVDQQDTPPVSGNEPALREMLINLIFNAVDAMPEGGAITLRTRSDGDHVLVEVSDTGTGMTEEVRERCLDPFFSTKGERGTGLGLAIVYGIIQRHQGTIDIKSERGHGTTLIIQMPAHTEQEGDNRAQETNTPSRQLRVLVVDDEPPVRGFVTDYLTGDGHTVETAANGREGLEKFHTAGWFDVVLTDRGMPEMSGDQLAAAIKRVAPNKPVIMLTGFGDLMDASGEKPDGVDCIVSKPVTLAALREALAKVAAE